MSLDELGSVFFSCCFLDSIHHAGSRAARVLGFAPNLQNFGLLIPLDRQEKLRPFFFGKETLQSVVSECSCNLKPI
jgi:hypothetical protein